MNANDWPKTMPEDRRYVRTSLDVEARACAAEGEERRASALRAAAAVLESATRPARTFPQPLPTRPPLDTFEPSCPPMVPPPVDWRRRDD